jgi:hypothetical protein
LRIARQQSAVVVTLRGRPCWICSLRSRACPPIAPPIVGRAICRRSLHSGPVLSRISGFGASYSQRKAASQPVGPPADSSRSEAGPSCCPDLGRRSRRRKIVRLRRASPSGRRSLPLWLTPKRSRDDGAGRLLDLGEVLRTSE